MKTKLQLLWASLRASYWFVPTLMIVGTMALSFVTVWIDQQVKREYVMEAGYFYTGGAEGARSLFTMVAGSMMAVAGVSFSVTIVALTLATQQFGPRLLYSFMRDLTNQVVLGTFVSTFVYCLLVVRTVRTVEENAFVPHISVTVAIVLALCSIALFIVFIHHIASSINVAHVIDLVSRDLYRGIECPFPQGIGQEPPSLMLDPASCVPSDFKERATPVRQNGTGYLQSLDADNLLEIASTDDLLIMLLVRPGDFVEDGATVALVYSKEANDGSLAKRLARRFILGPERSPLQDTKFSLNQLVEIGIRALSPSINDPHTAVACIAHLTAALGKLARRQLPSEYRFDKADRLRIVTARVTFGEFADVALDEFRQYAGGSAAVYFSLLEGISRIASTVTQQEARDALQRHAIMIERAAMRNLSEELDQTEVKKRFSDALQRLSAITTDSQAIGSN